MIDIDLAREITRLALGTGGAYADLLCQRKLVTQVRFEDGQVDDISTGLDLGAGVRVIRGDLAAYAHTDFVDEEHLALAARTAAEALQYADEGTPLVVVTPGDAGPREVCGKGGSPYELRAVVERLAECDDAARSLSAGIRQVTAIHASSIEKSLFANSLGEARAGACRRTRLVVQVVAGRDGLTQTGMEAPGSLSGPEFYDSHDAAEVARVAARRALTMLDARPSPTGRMPVVINSGTGGVLLHEACGHGLEVDHVHKGASVYAGKLDSVVASPVVTAVDDPCIPGLWGSYEYDDEGTPPGGTVLIEDGVLRGYLYSRHEAMKDGRASTGNGRRQSFRFLPAPRMSNTFISPRDADREDIIASTPKGLYAHKMGGGQVDPVTGDYVFSVSEGYLIENGRIGAPVRGAVLIGNGARTLEAIDAVADDLAYDEGTCGKDGQGVPVTTGCATFRIEELTVGGTEI